jgi:hypothetical protein
MIVKAILLYAVSGVQAGIMPVKPSLYRERTAPMIYPNEHKFIREASIAVPLIALFLGGCGINPNFQTIFTPNAPTYSIEGAVTLSLAAHPKIGYVQSEGDNPDLGSFHKAGDPASGIDPRGIYIPSALIHVDIGRFKMTFTSTSRYVFIRIFGWDDINNNGVRDINEPLASEYTLDKKDLNGWKYNAPEWNQFNFTFNQ